MHTFSCKQGPNVVQSERSRYLGIMQVMSDHIKWSKHTSLHACMLFSCLYAMFLHAQAHILAKYGQIRDIKVPKELGEHAWHIWADYVTHSHKLVFIAPSILACTDPYLGLIGSDQRDQSIYGIEGTCQTCLSTKYDKSTKASAHASPILTCMSPQLTN